MSRRRRAILLGALAVVLGTLAASDVSRRERALERRIGPLEPVLVARTSLGAGQALTARALAVRRIPARFVGPGTFSAAPQVAGSRTSVPLVTGTFVTDAHLEGEGAPEAGPPIEPGERVAELIATGSPDLIEAGTRVDVLVTREESAGGPGRTTLALEDVEVLAAAAAPQATGEGAERPRVSASLRVTPRQAVFLAAAQSFARELRLLPRAPGDRRRGLVGTEVGAGL